METIKRSNLRTNTTLHLAKQNFKFSSAHFLIFDEHRAEMLHGHNYRVKVDIAEGSVPSAATKDVGYMIDFFILKKKIKDRLDQWDERILLPAQHPDMNHKVSLDGKNYEIRFRDRFYSFPMNEVVWLDITNTSVENFSQILAKEFYHEILKLGQIEWVRVTVEETAGQSASTRYGA